MNFPSELSARDRPPTPPKSTPGAIHAVILKIAAPCNLNCSYCYVYNHEDKSYRTRPIFISEAVSERVWEVISDYCDRRSQHTMGITFHGGEPTLIGAKRLDLLARRAKDVLGPRLRGLSIQTNATLIDQDWIDVFQKNDVKVGVSLDGPREVNDMFRVDHSGRSSYDKVIAGLSCLQKNNLDPSILCVVNPTLSGADTFRYFLSLGIRRMNFLLPDATHDSKRRLYGHLGATPVADYLIPAFDAWFDLDDPDVKISLFTDFLRMMMGGESETDAFSNPLMSYVVIETDGSIEALDALRVCEENIASSGLNVVTHGLDDLHLGRPLLPQAIHEGFALAGVCQRCSERDLCGGGYLPHRYARTNGFDNPSVWCLDILKLLGHIRGRLEQAARA
jgi:uncharacterized protein